MTNSKILERVAALYASGEIDAAKLDDYIAKNIITIDDKIRIMEAHEWQMQKS